MPIYETKWSNYTDLYWAGILYEAPQRSPTVETIMARISGYPEGHEVGFPVRYTRIANAPQELPGPTEG